MRFSGILMHISSLPGPYGIGTMGRNAFRFIDFLKKSRQHYWQILPVGPTGFGDSPYQSFSSYAGNHYLIDLEQLIRQGLLMPEEAAPTCCDPAQVDYGVLYQERNGALRKAYGRFCREDPAFLRFVAAEREWLTDYCLYMALKSEFQGLPWLQWPEDIRFRRPEAMTHYSEALKEEIGFHQFLQYTFFTQWNALRRYAGENGLEIIGDVPIYVPLDSAEVWAEPGCFQLDRKTLYPERVAGVPPDYFSADGQLWGNPLYDWDAMEKDGYRWWIRRLSASARIFDVVRIDHFRGLESYWAVPYGDTSARNGCWVKGPGMAFIRRVKQALPHLRFIAEDLGYVTREVMQLVEDSGFPGMKVLEFAFDSREAGDYMPHTYTRNTVCYTGTHDNETLVQWATASDPRDYALACRYLGKGEGESICSAVIRAGMASVSDTFIVQMQDWLELGEESRMNQPGTLGGRNWRWRCGEDALSDDLAARIGDLTALYRRG